MSPLLLSLVLSSPMAQAAPAAIAVDDIVNLVFSGNFDSGGYGSTITGITKLDDTNALVGGGRGGWVINHVVAIGAFGLATTDTETGLGLTYGGMFVEGFIFTNSVIHPTVEVGFGAGKANLDTVASETVTLPHIGARLEYNATQWLRFAIGPTYRMEIGVADNETDFPPLKGSSWELLIKAGDF